MKNENLSIYYIDKKSYKSVEAHRKYCIMRLESRQNGLSKTLPPIFFRDMSSDLYYDMLFCKTQLITMLNPSFILDYLSKNKCHVLVDKEKKKVEVTKEVNEKEYKINMDCLFNVISSFMLSEKAVIQLLDEILERIETEPQRIIRILM